MQSSRLDFQAIGHPLRKLDMDRPNQNRIVEVKIRRHIFTAIKSRVKLLCCKRLSAFLFRYMFHKVSPTVYQPGGN